MGGGAVLAVYIRLAAAGGGIGAGVAVQTDEIVGAPRIGGVDPRRQAGGVAHPELFARIVARQPHVKKRVLAQQLRQPHAHFVVDVLLPQSVCLGAGVGILRIVPLINKQFHSNASLINSAGTPGSAFIVCAMRRKRLDDMSDS